MKIALTGNPNSGKTTMYNLLTGRKEKVGNWAGVTVEKSEFCIRDVYCEAGGEKLIAVDLPGTYSMSPFTSEEVVTSEYVKNENPDVIINILDSTNLSRGLFFTTQLLELGIPVVVALNKWDLCEKMEIDIDEKELEEKLKCPVVKTISAKVSNNGLKSMISEAVSCKGKEQKSPYNENKLEINNRGEAELADRRRFEFVKEIVAKVVKEREPGKETGDKCRKKHIDRIDRILTVPWFGIPIFAVIMFLVFLFPRQHWAHGFLSC